MAKQITTPLTKDVVKTLKAGERVLITGEIYTARDAAHKRMIEALAAGEPLPFDVKDKIIYYAGPAPAKPGEVIGSCGPTTSRTRGRIYARAFGPRIDWNARQRRAQRRGGRIHAEKLRGLLCRQSAAQAR